MLPFASFLSRLGMKRRGSKRRLPGRKCFPLRLEALEEILAPALIAWDGGGNDLNWNNRFNWSTDLLPGPNDDVTIGALNGNPTIALTGGSATVHSVQSQEPLQVAGTTLSVGSLTGTDLSVVTGGVLTTTAGQPLSVTLSGFLYVDATSGIDGDGLGYTQNGGPGSPGTAEFDSGGGGYGGAGGGAADGWHAPGGRTYGSVTQPTDLGSGGGVAGGHDFNGTGAGGGALRLVVGGTLTVDGRVSADGQAGTGGYGGGSGGSLWITAGTLAGSGVVSADGGSNSGTNGGGGGGGRIALYTTSVAPFNSANIHANGAANGGPGTVYSETTPTVVTSLTPGTPYHGTLSGSGQAQLFSVDVPAAQALSIQLADSAAGHNELYVQFGSPPTAGTYDYGSSVPGASQSLLVPSAAAGPWYVLVYGESVPQASAFSLAVTGATTTLTALSTDHAGNSSPATLTLTGAGFAGDSTVSLVASDGVTTFAPSSFSVDSFTQITATFPANLPAGTYSARVTTHGNAATLPASFTVITGGTAHLETHLVLPSALGRHAVATLYVEYANTGTVAMPAPLLELSNPNNDRPLLTLDQSRVTQGFWTSAVPDGFSTTISILASGKTPGVLQPGESVTVPVYYAGLEQPWDRSHTTVPFNLGVVTASDSTTIDWDTLEAGLRPDWIRSDAWDPIFRDVIAQAGSTAGGYVQMLVSVRRFHLAALGSMSAMERRCLPWPDSPMPAGNNTGSTSCAAGSSPDAPSVRFAYATV